MLNFLSGFIAGAAGFAFDLLIAIIIFIVGIFLSNWLVKLVFKTNGIQKLDEGIRSFVRSFMKIFLYVIVFMVSAGTVGIPMTSFVTVLASCGAAIALALQGGLGNLAGGIMILIFKPFKIGDFIEAQGCSGTVNAITIFYTIIKTGDNKTISLPNGALTNSAIINYSTEENRRVDLTFSVSYDADIEKVKSLLLESAANHKLVFKDPAPFARLSVQNASSLDFVLRVWTKSSDYWSVYFDLNETIKKVFDENGIEIPYAQLDVHMNNKNG